MEIPRPKKSLGQHFLHDIRIAERIVSLLDLHEGEQILEIGPGRGILTQFLIASHPSHLILLEKDHYWAEAMKAQYAQTLSVQNIPLSNEFPLIHSLSVQKNSSQESVSLQNSLFPASDSLISYVEIRNEDALQFSWESLEGHWKIISNLPYNVGSPIIWELVRRTPHLDLAVFMLQKEVAERVCAKQSTHAYGALSVWVQSFMRVEWGFTVGSGAFTPPPKVDSAVIRLLPLDQRPENPDALNKILKCCFQQRRKQLQSLLRRVGLPKAQEWLDDLGIDPTARPENLSPSDLQQLAKKANVN